MEPPAIPTAERLIDVLRRAGEALRRASGADIVTLYLFDAEEGKYYAPVALGIPATGLDSSISDMQDQLTRFNEDVAAGKAPADLQPAHYGPNVWLTVRKQALVALDAPATLNNSFIRRHHIRAVIGLPLLVGETLIGLVYLDFAEQKTKKPPTIPDSPEALERLGRQAAEAAREIDRARQAEERTALVTGTHLATHLTAAAVGSATTDHRLRRELGAALAHLIAVTGFDAALVYDAGRRTQLTLVAQQGFPGAPAVIPLRQSEGSDDENSRWDPEQDASLRQSLSGSGLHISLALPLRVTRAEEQSQEPDAASTLYGRFLVLSRDPLALLRSTPATRLLLESTAELIGGALAGEQLILTLEDANRVLSALGRLGGIMLTPGATRQQVLDAVVRHLIDPDVPEFAFQFATVFLLADSASTDSSGSLTVRQAAGATTDERIDALPLTGAPRADARPIRVPRWVQLPERSVSADDVLAYVARQRQIVVVGPAGSEGNTRQGEPLVTGYPPALIERHVVAVQHGEAPSAALVPVAIIGSREPSVESALADAPEQPFSLDAAIFETSGHRELLRIFVPFGLSGLSRATGVLEVGYHRAQRQQIARTQVEALRAAAAQLAGAVETARLYEETKRHAEQLEIIADVSKAMASSLDLDQTLHVVAKCLARSVAGSFCQIALYEDDGSAWYGAASSDDDALWRRQRGERRDGSFLFDLLQTKAPLIIDDAATDPSVNPYYARLFGIRSMLALPLIARGRAIGAAILAQQEQGRRFSPEEIQRAEGLSHQAAIAIQNARIYASAEEDPHIQRDVVLVGFGEWGQKAYDHLLTLKQFFNFKIHIVERDAPDRRQALKSKAADVHNRGDAIYWDSAAFPARDQLRRELESSCYVITYIATPAATHLPVLAQYYDFSNVVVIEKPLGAPVEAYREFLDSVEAGVQIVAADHYYFKLEVRLLHLLLTEERTLKSFLDDVEEIEIELIEERPLRGAAADIGIIEDMMPHAFAIVSLLTPIDRIQFDPERPVQIARQEPLEGSRETYARISGTFPHGNRTVRLTIDVGKGIENSKWIKLIGEKRLGGRPAFYKFDFAGGRAVDGTQTNLRAAMREIRQPGVPDNAHLTMLRHVIERRYPAVGILAIREAMRSNQRIGELAELADALLKEKAWSTYRQGQRPQLPEPHLPRLLEPSDEEEDGTRRVG